MAEAGMAITAKANICGLIFTFSTMIGLLLYHSNSTKGLNFKEVLVDVKILWLKRNIDRVG